VRHGEVALMLSTAKIPGHSFCDDILEAQAGPAMSEGSEAYRPSRI